MARGNRGALSWTIVKARIINLLVPFTVWSLACFVGDALQGNTYSPVEYLARLLTGKADGGGYYFVPVLCEFYLLSPFIVYLARTRWRPLMLAAALVQLGAIWAGYMQVLRVQMPGLPVMSWATAPWLPFLWAVYFPLGVVCGVHLDSFKGWFVRRRRSLLALVFILAVVFIVEGEISHRALGVEWRYVPDTITSALYSVAFILCFLAFAESALPFSGALYKLGTKSYGIYLLHAKVMEFAARVVRQILPGLLAYQLLFSAVLFLIGLGIPLLLMTAVTRSPTRRFYRYLFG